MCAFGKLLYNNSLFGFGIFELGFKNMRAVIQRVSKASVRISDKTAGQIKHGLVVLAAIGEDNSDQDITYMAEKIANLRIFEDDAGKMNKSVLEVKGGILAISNFTLYGDVRRGRRPDFTSAAKPDKAKPLFDKFVELLKGYSLKVEVGEFQAMMDVELVNSGPVTILLDSKKSF